jgi:pimeloyl-ACP methyl ester carboxylesterase
MHDRMDHATLELADGRRIAYCRSAGEGPGIVFLGGFRSDMTGTKARLLEAWARARGQAFLRFDYTGHGASAGVVETGAIGDAWISTLSMFEFQEKHILLDYSIFLIFQDWSTKQYNLVLSQFRFQKSVVLSGF